MAVDQNTLLDQILQGQELIDGIRNEMPDFDDRVCRVREVTSISGTTPYLTSKSTMGKDKGSQAIGADPHESQFELGSLAYACVQYGEQINVPKAVVVDLDQYMEALGEMARTLMETNAVARESDLAAIMTDATYNGQQPVSNGTWDNPTSQPVVDMLNLKLNKVPKVDTVAIGATSAVELMTHPDITAMAGLGFASSGAVDESGLQRIVGALLGVPAERVLIWDTFYDSAAQGQTATLARVKGDFFWAGQQKGLLKLALKGMQGHLSLIEGHTAFSQAVTDTCQYQRVDSFLGAELTGL